jgi:hypothetical protein
VLISVVVLNASMRGAWGKEMTRALLFIDLLVWD